MQPSESKRVQSVNVGPPREVLWKGQQIRAGIFKGPVEGRVAVRRLNLDGDQQADLEVHGGPSKAVYIYPADYYAFWREQSPEMEMPCYKLAIKSGRDDILKRFFRSGSPVSTAPCLRRATWRPETQSRCCIETSTG